jgi:tRNA pseudouridine38-40 synthase
MNDSPHIYRRNCELRDGMQLPQGMHRYAAAIEYDGADFRGFQIQASAPNTVQAALQDALSSIANEPIVVTCAGRTDAGVHATQQVIHFDTLAIRPDRAWVAGTNTQLPDSVRVHWVQPVDGNFHARFSARARRYRYLLYCDDVRQALLARQLTWCKYTLDIGAMQTGADFLLGEQDFTSFRASQCQAKSPMRNLQSLNIRRQGQLILLDLQANAFLHHMVRNIVGVLIEVGRGSRRPDWVKEVLRARDRKAAAATAPAHGLYFVGVDYPEEFALPELPAGPLFLE